MRKNTFKHIILGFAAAGMLAACGGTSQQSAETVANNDRGFTSAQETQQSTGTTIWEAFGASGNDEVTVKVNKYLWTASLEVLNFLPVESVDPFTGVIVTGFGTPPGSGRAYRATVLIDDPALDARSLNVSLQTRNGPASASAVRAVENAILSRARQLRIADDAL
jgi:ABC-type glycerol-3-phosphate transport system substrate-binding protein